MNYLKKILPILISLIFLFSCGKIDNSEFDNTDDLVSNARENIKTISVTDFKKVFDKKLGNIIILDCREAQEYAENHIAGAINVPRGLLEFSSKIANRRNKYYIYSNTQNRASLACQNLKYIKYKNVILIEGGFEEWEKTYPKLIEAGASDGNVVEEKKEESEGCGG